MTTASRKHFEVRSARNAEFFRSERPWAAISITSGHEFPTLSEAKRVGLLQLVFDDITQPDAPRSFTPALAAEILDFVASVWDQAEVLLIHCDIGLSRSPAVAAALSRIYYGDDGQWFEMDFPNHLVYDVLLEAHSRRPRPQAAHQIIGSGATVGLWSEQRSRSRSVSFRSGC